MLNLIVMIVRFSLVKCGVWIGKLPNFTLTGFQRSKN